MGMYHIGEVIRRTREELHLTQQSLCEGICSPETLSRIENGKRMPNRETFRVLMERMGKSGERYLPLLNCDDIDMVMEQQRLDHLLEKFQVSQLEIALGDFEKRIDMEDNINRQFILRLRAFCDYQQGKINSKEKIELLVRAIQCTIPSFDGVTISNGILSKSERRLFCNLAISYGEAGDLSAARNLLEQLRIYMVHSGPAGEEQSERIGLLYSNLSQVLGRLGRTEDALQLGEQGIKDCLLDRDGRRLPKFLYNTAFEMELLGKAENVCQERLIQAYYAAELNNSTEEMTDVENHYLKIYGKQIDC